MNEPIRCCALCGHPLMRRSKPFIDLRDLQCATCGGFGVRAPDEERSALSAVLVSLAWWIVVIVAVMFVAWCVNPQSASADVDSVPRWAAVKWERGIALMADFGVPQSPDECAAFVAKRNAVYQHAGVTARWTCEDLRPGEKSA